MRQTFEELYKDFLATLYKEQTKIFQELHKNLHFPAIDKLLDVRIEPSKILPLSGSK